MPASLVAPSLLPNTSAGDQSVEGTGTTGSAEAETGPFLSSTDLLQGRKTVAIAHNGLVYRLQATRLGKLILTK